MKERLNGFKKIFSFTFKNQVKQRKFIMITVVAMILCFTIPFAAILYNSGDKTDPKDHSIDPKEERLKNLPIDELYIVDKSNEKIDLGDLTKWIDKSLDKKIDITHIEIEKEDEVLKELKNSKGKVLLIINQTDKNYSFDLITGRSKDKENYNVGKLYNGIEGFAQDYMDRVNPKKESEEKDLKDILLSVSAYLNVFILYMFVIIYGQSVAGSVVLEKSSKLMETMLISVKPAAMILGKVLAISFSGIIQVFSFILSGYFGLIAGSLFIQYTGRSGVNILHIQKMILMILREYLSPLNLIVALLLIFMGILMYCTLASISGAISSRKEDLAATNGIFTLIIVGCFLICMLGGGLQKVTPSNAWLGYVPFTSVMVAPARIIFGEISRLAGMLSFGIMLLTTLALAYIAGKFYVGLALYKEKLPSLKELVQLLKR